MSEPLWQPRSDRAARLLGLAFLAGGGALLYWQFGGTLAQARAGVERVEYSFTLIAFGALWAALGLLWLGRGLAGYGWVRSVPHDRRARRILIIVTIVLVLASRWFLSAQLSALGYHE